jgi:prevent-host-death family protein
MHISVTDAKAQLTDLVRRAQAGDEVVLTRHGQPAARIVPVRMAPDAKAKEQAIRAVQASAALKITAGPDAARSQDFLYDDDGLPG